MSPRLAVVPELDRELDDLFGRPLSEFTTARNELARRLKKAGQEEAAGRVQALRKPSVPVWAVNQLARRHPDEVKELVDAGERLRKAQQAAFRGSGRDAVREATTAERTATRTLTRLARDLLAEDGRPPTRAVTDRIDSLLRSSAIEPEAAELLVAGRLSEEVDSTGFGAVAEIAPARPPRAKQLERRAEEADERAARAEQAAEEARSKAREARAAADEVAAALESFHE